MVSAHTGLELTVQSSAALISCSPMAPERRSLPALTRHTFYNPTLRRCDSFAPPMSTPTDVSSKAGRGARVADARTPNLRPSDVVRPDGSRRSSSSECYPPPLELPQRLPSYFDRTMSAHRNGGGDAADERSLDPPHSRCADEDAIGVAAFRLRAEQALGVFLFHDG